MRKKPMLLAFLPALALAGCVAPGVAGDASLVPPLIAGAIVDNRLDSESAAECAGLYPDSTFVVAFRSDAGQVAEIGITPSGRSAADLEGLPRDPETPALICVSRGIQDDVTLYMATWISGGGEGVISMFSKDDLIAATQSK